jgi:pentatricopeptide repeat protein
LWEIADNYLKLGQLEEAWQVSNSMESNEQIKRLNILCQKYGELEQKEKVDERK